MRLLAITDLHGRSEAIEAILREAGWADALLLGGDITSFGSPIDAERIVRAAQQRVPEVWAVAGNCDSPAIEHRLQELGVALHGRGILRGSVGIHGLSAIPPWKRSMYQFSEEQLDKALTAGYAQIDGAQRHVVLAHVPPYGLKLDRAFFFKHAGSTALRTFVERTQPALVICGHIHEGRGIEMLGPTTVVNCGFAGHGDYALADVGDAGVRVELRRWRG